MGWLWWWPFDTWLLLSAGAISWQGWMERQQLQRTHTFRGLTCVSYSWKNCGLMFCGERFLATPSVQGALRGRFMQGQGVAQVDVKR